MKFTIEAFKVPMYNYDISIILTDDLEVYCREQLSHEVEVCPIANVFDFRGKDYPVDFLVVFTPKAKGEDTIAHEVFHLTARIMRYIGCPLTEETEEPYAYLQDYLTRVIKNKLLRMNGELTKLITEANGSDTNTREEVSATTGGG